MSAVAHCCSEHQTGKMGFLMRVGEKYMKVKNKDNAKPVLRFRSKVYMGNVLLQGFDTVVISVPCLMK